MADGAETTAADGTALEPGFLARWVTYVSVGEAVGFLVPATAGVLSQLVELAPGGGYVLAVVAGAGEGALLGLAQALALRRSRVAVPTGAWVLATAAAAAVAWGLGMLPTTVPALDWGSLPVLALAVVGALLLLGSIPLAQWLVLRRYVPRAWRWIPLNAVAWGAGLMWTFAPSPLIDESTPVAVLVVTYAVAGLLLAVTVALITGLGLRRMLERPSQGSAPPS